MNRLDKLKPAGGFSAIVHVLLVAVLPLIVFILVRLSFVPLAYAVILASKWRMLAVRPRHWPANIRANAIDIIVGLSFVSFIAGAPSQQSWQLVWAICYGIWLTLIKPRSSTFWNAIQAGAGQILGLASIYALWGRSSLLVLVVATWAVCYLAARHFLSSFDEPLSSMISHAWGYFGAALTWVLGHWLLYYAFISQPMLILSVLGVGIATLYYLETNDRLSVFVRREILLVMSAVIIVVLLFSSWGDKAV
ncbi:MAG: rane protein of unknown function [Candidatus Saccharibacteria bacterium]|nr:rane protein of unknown function [Candidatus Saccharibacteria bacterium]